MTVGEVIALLCKQASDEDIHLMTKSIYSIDVNDDEIYLHFTDGNTEDYSIKAESENIEALSNQPKIGHWKWMKSGKDIDICCSECGYAEAPEYAYDYELCELDKQELVKFTMTHQFCTWCGTKMESEK